jgi:hypothetical protein
MRFIGSMANEQSLTDFFIAKTFGDKFENLFLPNQQ